MTRTILTKVGGFTPVIDGVSDDVGREAAYLFGVIWRYCQMQNGVCYASIDNIAERANVERKYVIRYVKVLCEYGYLKDLTPDQKHAPHVYADTGKAQLVGELSGEVVQNESPNSEVSQKGTPSLEESQKGTPTPPEESQKGIPLVSQKGTPRSPKKGHKDSSLRELKDTNKKQENTKDLFSNSSIEDEFENANLYFSAAKQKIQEKISRQLYDTWVQPLRVIFFDHATQQLVLGVYNETAKKELLANSIDVSFRDILKKLWIPEITIAIIVKPPEN